MPACQGPTNIRRAVCCTPLFARKKHTLMQHDSGYDVPQLNPGSRLHKYLGAGSPGRPSGSSMSPMSVNVPSFVPQFARMQMENGGGGQGVAPPAPTPSRFQAGAEEFVPQDHGGTIYYYNQGGLPPAYEGAGAGAGGGSTGGLGSPIDQQPEANVLVNTGGSYSYQLPPLHTGKFRPKLAATNPAIAQFVSPDVKMELMSRQLAMKAKPEAALYPELPQAIEHMRDIVPLEAGSVKPAGGYQQSVYKATSARDGVHYVLRRVHAFRPINAKAFAPAEQWKKLQAAHVVQLRECFATRAFNDNSLIFVYDYHPLSESLKERHFGRGGGTGGGGVTMVDTMTGGKILSSYSGSAAGGALAGSGVPELLLWQYVVQLTAALRSIHAQGLAAKSIDISKVILMGKCKLLLSSCGVLDLVAPDHQQIQQQQSDDMVCLGRLILALATGNQHAGRRENMTNAMTIVGAHYSQDMKNLITCLLGPSPRKTIADVMPMIGARFYHHIEALQSRVDLLENETARELENGRLFRLLCKLNTIVERPEHNMDTSWSETGDRFLIKLFRDYVFHQVTDQGKPWMDMAHIVSCMNKLDAGVAEKIELVSRDQDNVIIVSFGDLRRCIDAAFAELSATTIPPRGANNQRHH